MFQMYYLVVVEFNRILQNDYPLILLRVFLNPGTNSIQSGGYFRKLLILNLYLRSSDSLL